MKIFALALHRSGSKSLNEALGVLGYRSLFSTSLAELEDNLDEYDAFTHDSVLASYKELDARFPGSKFVFLTREKESWIEACRQFPNLKPDREPKPSTVEIRLKIYETIPFDEAIYRQRYDDVLAEVADHFAARPDDLLWMDVTGGEGWENLCRFLDKPVPSVPFPKTNTARQTYRSPWVQAKLAFLRQGSRVKQAMLRVLARA